jgi:glutamate-ammonia-ligase adenylyltransferase
VSSIEAFRTYYEQAAAFWEFQALLKARPVAGHRLACSLFLEMSRDALMSRGSKIAASDILQMRERIMRERSKESEGYDIKLGPGGIEDIEFLVQFLQLRNCAEHEKLLVQGTIPAIHRLSVAGILGTAEGRALKETYTFYRSLESLLRLRGESVVKSNTEAVKGIYEFMGFESPDDFLSDLEGKRADIGETVSRHLRDS